MKKLYLIMIGLFISIISFTACESTSDEPATPKPTISTENSYVINIDTQRLPDARTVVISTTKVFVKNSLKFTTTKIDTLPFLGTETVKITDNDGNEKDTLITKEYDIYTVIK